MTVDDEDDLNGTYRSIRPWIDDGRITAYGGLGTLIVTTIPIPAGRR
jgi:hypothetical protein